MIWITKTNMSNDLPEDWWITNLEDEPCDGCGVIPSKHRGHGSYICKKCWDASFCPTCHYGLQANHVCPTAEERERYEKEAAEALRQLGLDE